MADPVVIAASASIVVGMLFAGASLLRSSPVGIAERRPADVAAGLILAFIGVVVFVGEVW